MKILGMNIQHDGGCCLMIDGEIACAVTEDRLTRKKSAAGWWYALRYCLDTTGVELADIDLAVFSSYGEQLPSFYDGGLTSYGLKRGRAMVIDHHVSHAASAFWGSGFDRVLVVVIDGLGNDGDTESYFLCDRKQIERIGGNLNRTPGRGTGKTYEAFTSFLGWPMIESGSTMALAACGDPDRYAGVELFDVHGDQINSYLPEKYLQGVIRFAERAGVDFGSPFDRGKHQSSRDVARFVQDRTEKAILQLISNLLERTGARKVCLAGGVALNCVLNEKIRKLCGVDALYVPPMASDRGQAIGNAMFGHALITGGGRPTPISRDSFGRTYSSSEILKVLDLRQELGNNFIVEAPPLEYIRTDRIEKEVASLLAKGKTVGWMQGGSEMGPRALGHRSILADPRALWMQQHLSESVKKRAWFRPYSPSVLATRACSFFDLDVASPFMLLAPRVKEGMADLIPAVVHVDQTSRPQTVSAEAEPQFHKLISAFEAQTGVPMVLNTSFNLAGEPIVETPRDALSAFLRTGLDYLAIEDCLIWKKSPSWNMDRAEEYSREEDSVCLTGNR